MFCTKCGKKIEYNASVCNECLRAQAGFIVTPAQENTFEQTTHQAQNEFEQTTHQAQNEFKQTTYQAQSSFEQTPTVDSTPSATQNFSDEPHTEAVYSEAKKTSLPKDLMLAILSVAIVFVGYIIASAPTFVELMGLLFEIRLSSAMMNYILPAFYVCCYFLAFAFSAISVLIGIKSILPLKDSATQPTLKNVFGVAGISLGGITLITHFCNFSTYSLAFLKVIMERIF